MSINVLEAEWITKAGIIQRLKIHPSSLTAATQQPENKLLTALSIF